MPSYVLRRAKGAPALDSRTVRRAGDRMLAQLELEAAELSILLTNDANIRELNRQHRGQDKPTDVLAFALESDLNQPPTELGLMLGDVVISLDTAARQAPSRHHQLQDEVLFLLAHGLLHLLGYDHQTDRAEREMNDQARHLVAAARR